MAASYPGSIKSFTTKVNLVDTVDASHVNDLQLEVAALETELGINPPDVDDTVDAVSAAADLAVRLDHIVNIIKTMSGETNWYDDNTVTLKTLEDAILQTLLPSKGDMVGASAANVAARVPISTNDLVLTADSSATPGVSWQISKALDLITTAGDILYGTAADTLARLGLGTANFVLEAGASAPAWTSRTRYVQLIVADFTTDVATGDGQFYFHVPADLAGLDLTEVHAENITAGVTGTMSVQIHNLTTPADMLTNLITIDTTETGSDTAATPALIDVTEDDVAENDLLRIDIDTIQTTPAKGLIITLGFN